MICSKCNSEMYHSDGWEECWDGETEECYWWGRWDCLECGHFICSYDDGYEGVE